MLQSEVKNLILGDNEIEWATGLRYLGVLFTSSKVLTAVQTRKFYAASNSILHNSTYVSEMSRLHLIEAYALPLLTNAYEAVNICLLLKFMSYQYAGIMCIEDSLECISGSQ